MDEELNLPKSIPASGIDPSSALRASQPQVRAGKPAGWQERLLPLMGGMLTTLTAFFFVVTLLQISYLHWSILQGPPIQLDSASSPALLNSSDRFEDLYIARQFEVRAAMERYIIEKRYHQVSVMLMSGLWLRYLGFITGMILALIGAAFILGKLRTSDQEITGKFSDFSLALRSTSPGIILAVLGTILMFVPLVDRDVYNVQDTSIYLSGLAPMATPRPELREALPTLPGNSETDSLPGSTGPAPTASPTSQRLNLSSPTLPPASGGGP